ncbi:MAG: hypothetical protein H0W43_01040 [Chthoniobacterales bacterium]|nr:hypothetical protein [Chthoniobacterales bacterium]
MLTPNLREAFPHPRFLAFFVAHGGIIVGVTAALPDFVVRVFAWSEVYFVITQAVDLLTGGNYGFLLHKPEAFSLLSLLSDSWPLSPPDAPAGVRLFCSPSPSLRGLRPGGETQNLARGRRRALIARNGRQGMRRRENFRFLCVP